MSYVMVRLMGGLGNQLFQYAAGKALAARLQVPLLADRMFIDDRSAAALHTLRDYELDLFHTEVQIATASQVKRMRRPADGRIYRRLRRFAPGIFPDHMFYETQKTFMKQTEELEAPVYLEGFWQCEKYFLSIAGQLREHDLIPLAKPSGANASLLEQIQSTPAVSIHVRRTDYVTNADANKFHGICSIDYYERAAKLIAEKTGADHFYVFSDDPEWVKQNIILPYKTTYISHNQGRESYWDLFLMQHCRHHIIANSSFSWWGAWLNSAADKMVIAPQNWFSDPASKDNDIIPPSWIKL